MLFSNLAASPDNQLHCLFSIAIVLFVFCGHEYINPNHRPAGLLWSLSTALEVGLAKELYDGRYGSGFCLVDLAYDLLGMAIAVIVLFTFIKIN